MTRRTMKLSYKIPAALLGVAATFALVQPQIAVGLSPEEVGKIAQEITVRIDGQGRGSGAIVGKEGNTYTVLTNCHVIEEPGTYIIVTHRGSSYQVEANQEMCQPGGIDLAVLRFSSTRSYSVANLGDSSRIVVGRKVYASGWVGIDPVNPERGYRFQQGNITGIQPRAREGYTLVHTNQSRPGMSGGPILDEEGDVVGINGLGFQEPNTGEWEFFGIPINTYKSWQVAVLPPEERSTPPPDNPSEGSRNTPPPSPLPPRPNSDNQTAYYSPTNYVLADTLKGHSDVVYSVAISPDGQLLASGSDDNTIKIWNLGSGRLLRTLTGHSGDVNSVGQAWGPDGQLLASGSGDRTIKIWNLGSGRLLRTLTGHSRWVRSVAISPDGQLLASGSDDRTIKIWNLGSGRLLRTLTGHSHWVNSVAISPDGQLLASGSRDRTIKIWNLESGRLLRTFKGHSHWVNSVAISPYGQLLASGSYDRTIKIWNLESGRLLRTLTGHSDWVRSVAFSPDGQTIVSGGGCSLPECNKDYDIRIWRVQGQ
ncbi:MAG: trypsin-like peptidase domain-containing protein [Hormoscilla sp. GM7CHS1pb]|nr:trypsin-like peptidase domain-containing protein [Hormoscilla sp. GM7CHS1pb]